MIRAVIKEELPVCLEVIHRSFQTVADEFGLTKENCPTNGAFMPVERLMDDYEKGMRMFALFHEGEMAGYMQLEQKGGDLVKLEKLAVLPQYRHLGFGKELLDFAKGKAKELGAGKLTLGMIDENTRLKNWYLANGFVSIETKVIPNLPFTVGYMECPLG